MSYDLTQRQKKIQVHRAIKKIINNTFIPGVLNELDNSIKNLEIGDDLLNESNDTIKNYLIDEFNLMIKNL